VDEKDRGNHLCCVEYVATIMQVLREQEVKHAPDAGYLGSLQREIDATKRAILIDWIIEVAEQYNLSHDTLHLSVTYLDRFLSLLPISRPRFQLLGATCLLIAAKYEEITAPTVADFVYITDYTYTRADVVQMELVVVDALKFRLTSPTPIPFLRRYLKASSAPQSVACIALFLIELALLHYPFLRFRPSTIAISAVSLALQSFAAPAWTPTMAHHAGVPYAEIHECVAALHEAWKAFAAGGGSVRAVGEKYAHAKYYHVSRRLPPREVYPRETVAQGLIEQCTPVKMDI